MSRVVSFKCDEKFLELIDTIRLRYGYNIRSMFIRDAIKFFIFYLNVFNNISDCERDQSSIDELDLPEKLYYHLKMLSNIYDIHPKHLKELIEEIKNAIREYKKTLLSKLMSQNILLLN